MFASLVTWIIGLWLIIDFGNWTEFVVVDDFCTPVGLVTGLLNLFTRFKFEIVAGCLIVWIWDCSLTCSFGS